MPNEYVGDGVTNSASKAIGWTFCGFVIEVFLAGASVPPIWTYFTREGKRDSIYLKLVILTMIILNWCHLGCAFQMMYFYCVRMAGNPTGLAQIPMGVILSSSFSKAGIAFSQIFFCYRIYIVLHRNIFVAIGFCLLLLTEIGAGIYLSVALSTYSSFVQFRDHKFPFVLEEFTPFAVDVIILVSTILTFHGALPRMHRKDGINSTPTRLARFVKQTVLYSIQINSITASIALASGLCYLLYHDSSAYGGIGLTQPFLYQLTVLITLNVRSTQRAKLFGNHENPEDVTLKTVDLNTTNKNHKRSNNNKNNQFLGTNSNQLTSSTFSSKDVHEDSFTTSTSNSTAVGTTAGGYSSEKMSLSSPSSPHQQHNIFLPNIRPQSPILSSTELTSTPSEQGHHQYNQNQEHTVHIPLEDTVENIIMTEFH